MKNRPLALLALLTLLTACLVPALAMGQEQNPRSYYPDHKWFGLGLQASLPYADFADAQNTGYGVVALADYPLVPWFSIVGDVGYNRFGGKGDEKDVEIWEFDVGGRVSLPPFFVGGEVGWFSGDEQVGWVPSLGVRLEHLELSVRWKAAGTQGWTSLRAGFYFW